MLTTFQIPIHTDNVTLIHNIIEGRSQKVLKEPVTSLLPAVHIRGLMLPQLPSGVGVTQWLRSVIRLRS